MNLQHALSLQGFCKKINLTFEAFSWIVILPPKGKSNILFSFVMAVKSLPPQQQ